MTNFEKQILAYIVGVALGDGNLSCPNKRTTRLRITCDNAYPKLGREIKTALRFLFPTNKISYVKRKETNCFDISVYSNRLNEYIPWKVGLGPKHVQNAHVPSWILENAKYIRPCLKGLIQTDGSIYKDRGYLMVNFTSIIQILANDVKNMMEQIGYTPHIYKSMQNQDGTNIPFVYLRMFKISFKKLIFLKSNSLKLLLIIFFMNKKASLGTLFI